MEKKTITDYELSSQGFYWPDYYQGFGTSFTKYSLSVLGAGFSEKEAFEDAMEQLAMMGYDTSIIDADPDTEGLDEQTDEDEREELEDSRMYYYGVRFNEPTEKDEENKG